jgi:hypothetical protein
MDSRALLPKATDSKGMKSLFHRQVRGLGAFENLTGISADLTTPL